MAVLGLEPRSAEVQLHCVKHHSLHTLKGVPEEGFPGEHSWRNTGMNTKNHNSNTHLMSCAQTSCSLRFSSMLPHSHTLLTLAGSGVRDRKNGLNPVKCRVATAGRVDGDG